MGSLAARHGRIDARPCGEDVGPAGQKVGGKPGGQWQCRIQVGCGPRYTGIGVGALPRQRGNGMNVRLARRLIAKLLGLGDRINNTPAQLSGGQQQRVAIARALATRPRIIFADEPTGNLDSETSRQVMDLFSQLNREEGITLVLVTHEADIAAYARRRIRFQDGRVVEDVAQAEVAA